MRGSPDAYVRAAPVNIATGDQPLFVDAGFPHARAFLCATGGTIALLTLGGDSVIAPIASGNVPLAISAVEVRASGTTASGIIALY